jgi:hypothetical protein
MHRSISYLLVVEMHKDLSFTSKPEDTYFEIRLLGNTRILFSIISLVGLKQNEIGAVQIIKI